MAAKQPKTPISNRGFDAQFLGTIPYQDPLVLDGMITSIDSVRIKYTYSKTAYDFESRERFDTLNRLLYELTSDSLFMLGQFDIELGREASFKIGRYMRTITYRLSNGDSFSVLVGRFCYDSTVKLIAPDVIMDVNPNKIPANIWHRIARILASTAQSVSVLRFDLAIDIPIARDQMQLLQRPGSGFEKFVDKNGGMTEYTGERSHHAAIKLYDKGADLEVPDLTCTRCEITIDPVKFKGIAALWPSILSLSPLDLSIDFADLPFDVKAVILHPDLHDMLKASVSRNTWPKHKRMIDNFGKTYFTLSDDQTKKIDQYVRNSLLRFTKTAL